VKLNTTNDNKRKSNSRQAHLRYHINILGLKSQAILELVAFSIWSEGTPPFLPVKDILSLSTLDLGELGRRKTPQLADDISTSV
jgi:hypothetical protein